MLRSVESVFLVAAAWICIIVAVLLGDCLGPACASEPDEAEVVAAVRLLQPAYSAPEAAAWGGLFFEAGVETDLDPLLLVAVAFRESSIRADVVGSRGELGPLQLHGVALRHMPRRCDARDIRCNVRGGAAYLQYCRALCGEPWAVWVGSYGLGRCPSVDEAEELRSVRRARELYERVGGADWR